ncbi:MULTISPECIES: hypothetical protein [Mameliella]|uniref:Short-chain dehydrogenase n=1 Tax=Mameliella alba TaxID=561184 RepID=A0A0B3SEC9_9RHOB|nr:MULTISPECIES: hypothetical protein [Mameliella]MBV6638940.1 hypothetical protein [Mameliella sp.]MCR9274172.1 hypothetical protein [Paracoccaceae bacterium]ODM48732.1 hypothetical protein A9320_03375 [Ruegeria sp. PBVC088]KHQ55066.1 Short-chain dehydrogenase [Mameliella alba]MBY6118782.1 hypothetical protein [Mameliella alba]
MIVKIVALFLVFIAVLGFFGKLRIPGAKQLGQLRDRARLNATKCPKCGRYRIGKGPCDCRKGDN